MSLSLGTKGRLFGPESKASLGALHKAGNFIIVAAKAVFKRLKVTRVFKVPKKKNVFKRILAK